MPVRGSFRDDTGAQIFQALVLVGVMGLTIASVASMHGWLKGTAGDAAARGLVHEEITDLLETTEGWCCPADPSAASRLQDAGMQAWAGDATRIERLLHPLYTEDPAKEIELTMGWQGEDDGPLHRLPLYATDDPDGATVGTQRWARLAERGPAFVVPRLENVSASSSMDVHVLPVSKWWPYSQGPLGEHSTWLRTGLQYSETTVTPDDGAVTVIREAYTELAGGPRPLMDLHFAEPDWTRMAENPLLEPEDNADVPTYRQVLTKDDLAAERLLDENVDPDSGVYPQHRFQLNVSLDGPGAVFGGNPGLANWTETEISGAFKVTVQVPRGWTDVEITADDEWENRLEDWGNSEVEALPGDAGYRVEAVLNVTANFTVAYKEEAGNPPRYVLNSSDRVEAPFYFHARPPAESQHADLGFQEVTARLESTVWRYHQETSLVVELPTDPGRVHRTLQVHAPRVIPPTGPVGGPPDGVEVPIGLTLLNGGEPLDVSKVRWRAPPGTFLSGPADADVLADFTEAGDASLWEVSPDGAWLNWTGVGVCGELEACPLAAQVTVDGAALSAWGRWRVPEAAALYEPRDVDDYVDWFVRSKRAWEGVPLDDETAPGFALAAKQRGLSPGEMLGGFLWRAPPSSTPICHEDEVATRNQAERHRRSDRVVYDLGPREDGLPVVGARTDPTGDPCTPLPGQARNLSLVAQAGGRWGIDAIGKARYQAVEGLTPATFAAWNNGVAESRITGDRSAAAGSTANWTIYLDSIFETLIDGGVADVTVKTHLVDPYNAWEGIPWWGETLARDAQPEIVEAPISVECGQTGCLGHPARPGTPDTVPSKIALSLDLPHRLIPGTHLLLVEVSWTTTIDGAEVSETGRVLRPIDVLLPSGERAMPTVVEGLAWLDDWG